MPITHAVRVEQGPRTVTAVRHEDGTYSVQMVTDKPGEDPIVNGCRLSHEAASLLRKALAELMDNLDHYEVKDEED